jgi:hypothetical protein
MPSLTRPIDVWPVERRRRRRQAARVLLGGEAIALDEEQVYQPYET